MLVPITSSSPQFSWKIDWPAVQQVFGQEAANRMYKQTVLN